MKALLTPILKSSPAQRRNRVRGETRIESGISSGSTVRVLDRVTAQVITAARSVGGSYSLQVPAEYAGLRRLLLLATYPTDQYNAVVADRVMPETVIE